jgi:hypothetical protein
LSNFTREAEKMLNHRPDVLAMAAFLILVGALVSIFAKTLVRVVGDRQRAIYGERGAAFASNLRPWGYRLAGGIIIIVGCLLLLLGLFAR